MFLTKCAQIKMALINLLDRKKNYKGGSALKKIKSIKDSNIFSTNTVLDMSILNGNFT